MLYDRFAENPAMRKRLQQRLKEKFLPDLPPLSGQPLSRQQFLSYAEKYALHLTPSLLQSYLRLGLLPRPVFNRYYARQHAALCNLLDRLRELLEVWEIRQLLLPLHEQGSFSSQDLTAAEWFYDLLQCNMEVEDWAALLRTDLERYVLEADGLREAQRVRLLAARQELRNLCSALDVAWRQFILRRDLDRRWRERRSLYLISDENDAVSGTIYKEVRILPETVTEEVSRRAVIRTKSMRRTKKEPVDDLDDLL